MDKACKNKCLEIYDENYSFCPICGKKLFYKKICVVCKSEFLSLKENSECCNPLCSTKNYNNMNKEKVTKYKTEWARQKRNKKRLEQGAK